MSPEHTATLRTQYTDEGMTIAEIARVQGVSSETVRRSLVEANIPRRPRGAPTGKHLPSGGRIKDKDGYWLVLAPDHPFANSAGYIREHRLVVERELGRYLDPEEVVAHRDGNPANNTVENLALYASASDLARATLIGNTRAKGDVGNPKRRIRRNRTPDQILYELARLQGSLLRDIKRSDLEPPLPSHRAVARAFGSWQAGVAAALARYGPNGLRGSDWSRTRTRAMTPRRDAA